MIPNGVDLAQFRPRDQQAARLRFGLPLDKKLILFGAHHATTDPNKGWPLLRAALEQLADDQRIRLAIFGAATPPDFPAVHLGTIADADELAALYAAADVFVLPSLQENLPNTIIEALACGVPAVGFDVGGIGELIEHQRSGALAQPYDPRDLAQQIAWVLADDDRWRRLAEHARHQAEAKFDLKLTTQRHLDLYNRLLAQESSC